MKGLCLSIVLFFSLLMCGQELPTFIQNAVEELAESEADIQLDDILESLQYYSENPLNLNYASRWQWKSFPLLSDHEKKALWDYKVKKGGFHSVYELSLIHI